MKSGIFLTFDGMDFAGKSTQADILATLLRSRTERKVVQVRDPGSTALSEQIRSIVKDPHSNVCATAELLLFAAARAQLVDEVIKPALAEGAVVISDRWVDSTYAYQGGGRGHAFPNIRLLEELTCTPVAPNLTFLFWVEDHVAAARRELAGRGSDKFDDESVAFRKRVNDVFRWVLHTNPNRVKAVDGDAPEHVVSQMVWEILLAKVPVLKDEVNAKGLAEASF